MASIFLGFPGLPLSWPSNLHTPGKRPHEIKQIYIKGVKEAKPGQGEEGSQKLQCFPCGERRAHMAGEISANAEGSL